MAFRLFIESSQGRRRGRRPRPQRIDDYAAHFHHHPWQDAQLALTPRLLKRLGEGVGGTADDGDESSEATVTLNVVSVNDGPEAVAVAVEVVNGDSEVIVTFTGSDVDNDASTPDAYDRSRMGASAQKGADTRRPARVPSTRDDKHKEELLTKAVSTPRHAKQQ